MKNHLHILLFLCFTSLSTMMSCINNDDNALVGHSTVVFKIDPSKETSQLKLDEYSIDSVCSLSFPDSLRSLYISKFYVKKDRIYIMDSENTHTVYVFDIKGNYLHKLGDRGRAKTEYLTGPDDFFVDKMRNVHVFDYNGQKIVSFTKDGSMFRIVGTGQYFPYSIGLTNNNRFAFCRADKSDSIPAMMFIDYDLTNPLQILPPLENSFNLRPSNITFFSNGTRLSHIPTVSDSVLVFKNDTLEKVVRFDFSCKFLSKEMPDAVLDADKVKKIIEFKGVRELRSYQETDYLAGLGYVYNDYLHSWFYIKHSKRIIDSQYGIFEGLGVFSSYNYQLRDKQIIAIVEQDIVDQLKRGGFTKEVIAESAPQVKDVIEGKIKVPALFYISIK